MKVTKAKLLTLLLSVAALVLAVLVGTEFFAGWTRLIGTPKEDSASDAAVHSTGIYIAGYVNGWADAPADAFIRKYDDDGNEVWTVYASTTNARRSRFRGISVSDRGVFVCGETEGALPGKTAARASGKREPFVQMRGFDGKEIWTDQFGSGDEGTAGCIAASGKGVYVVGFTRGALPGQTSQGQNDIFLRKYDLDGSVVWTRQFGTSQEDLAKSVALDRSGDVYVGGDTEGVLAGQRNAGASDVVVRKYDAEGSELWTVQFGTGDAETTVATAAGGAGLYVGGETRGAFLGFSNAGERDAFLTRLDPATGSQLWTTQYGSPGRDSVRGIAVEPSRVYAAGQARGSLSGQKHLGEADAYLCGFDPHSGGAVFTHQFGTTAVDDASASTTDSFSVYVVGKTGGTLDDQAPAGFVDGYIVKFRKSRLWLETVVQSLRGR